MLKLLGPVDIAPVGPNLGGAVRPPGPCRLQNGSAHDSAAEADIESSTGRWDIPQPARAAGRPSPRLDTGGWTVATSGSWRLWARDESYMKNYVLPEFGNGEIARITQLEVRAWVADLTARGLAPATVQKAYQILGKVLGAAVDGRLIAVSPCHKVPLPRIEAEEMRFLTPEEVARLACAVEPRYRAFVLLKAYGGLRLSEMAGLRRGRLDLLRSTVRVAEQAVEVRGQMYFGPPKT